MALARSILSRLRKEESGTTIIEVLVSAVLVAMLAVGVLKGLDAANAASGNGKNRAVAGDLASQDQERMRSFRAKELSSLNESRSLKVGGVEFTVVSGAQWINDKSVSRRCGQATGRADYLRITSTVSWDQMRGGDPVTQTSLYAPPNGSFADRGDLGIEVLDRNAAPVPGVSVAASGPTNVSATTDAQGCVYFSLLPQGNYTVSISKTGYVDPQGDSVISRVYGVKGGTTQVQPVDYDLAGSIQASVRSRRGAGTTDLVAATPNYLTVGHSQLDSPNTRPFGTGTAFSSFTMGGLYPFTSPYSVYNGGCSGVVPPTTLATPSSVTVTPGGTVAVTIREIAVRLRAAGAYLPNGTVVKMYPKGGSCSGSILLTTVTIPAVGGTPAQAGWIQAPSPSTDPGVPYGTYDICAQGSGYRVMVTNRAVSNPDGIDIDLGSNAVQGNCP